MVDLSRTCDEMNTVLPPFRLVENSSESGPSTLFVGRVQRCNERRLARRRDEGVRYGSVDAALAHMEADELAKESS
jgi:hypothetical protein